MPALLKNYIDLGYVDGGGASVHLNSARTWVLYAAGYIGDQEWALAEDALTTVSNELGYLDADLLADDVFNEGLRGHWRDALYWINDNWPSDGDEYQLTMSKILTAMWESETWETLLFVTRIDAMRGAIGEKTVTEKAMADQLRHFL